TRKHAEKSPVPGLAENHPAADRPAPAGNASTRSARAVPRAHPAAPRSSPTAEQRRSLLEALTPPFARTQHPQVRATRLRSSFKIVSKSVNRASAAAPMWSGMRVRDGEAF